MIHRSFAEVQFADAMQETGLADPLDAALAIHRRPVAEAIANGIPVQEKVLADYPDLTGQAAQAEPEHVVLIIGDGMGFEQVKAASLYLRGQTTGLAFERLPYQAEMTTLYRLTTIAPIRLPVRRR